MRPRVNGYCPGHSDFPSLEPYSSLSGSPERVKMLKFIAPVAKMTLRNLRVAEEKQDWTSVWPGGARLDRSAIPQHAAADRAGQRPEGGRACGYRKSPERTDKFPPESYLNCQSSGVWPDLFRSPITSRICVDAPVSLSERYDRSNKKRYDRIICTRLVRISVFACVMANGSITIRQVSRLFPRVGETPSRAPRLGRTKLSPGSLAP